MFTLSEFDKGFIAGIIDGEGCISVRKTRHYYKNPTLNENWKCSPLFEISNTNKELLIYIQRLLGGTLKSTPVRGNRKPIYRLSFNVTIMRSIIPYITQYLIVKRHQAELVGELLTIVGVRPGRNGYTEQQKNRMSVINNELKNLNHRGK